MALVTPHYLMVAASRKHGQDVILGATQESIDHFWNQGQMVALHISQPNETASYVVDVDTKQIFNDSGKEKDTELNTLLSSALGQNKTYHLGAANSNFGTFEGNISCHICPQFFQMIPLKVYPNPVLHSPMIGSSGNISMRFSKDYGVVAKMTLAPNCKSITNITTKLIVYQAKATVRVSFPASAGISIMRQHTNISCCGCYKKVYTLSSWLSATELLSYNGIAVHNYGSSIYFDTDRIISYPGEVTQVVMGPDQPILEVPRIPQENQPPQQPIFEVQPQRIQASQVQAVQSRDASGQVSHSPATRERPQQPVSEIQQRKIAEIAVELQELATEKPDTN